MAKAKKEKPSTAIVPYDAEFAAFAKDVAAQLTVGGAFISFQAGVISIGGKPVERNKLKVVILDNCHENAFYIKKFAKDDKSPPTCFAVGRDKATLKAHPNARANWQNPQVVGKDAAGNDIIESPCMGCPKSYGANPNKGGDRDDDSGVKTCANKERISLLSAEDLTAESIKNGEVLYAKLSYLNVKPFALYAKGLNEGFKRPPFGVITEIGTVPDAKSQFRVTFEMLSLIEKGPLAAAIIARHKAERENLLFGYPAASATVEVESEESKAGKGGRKKIPGGKAAKAPAAKRKKFA